MIANAAAKLNRNPHRRQDALDRCRIHRLARKGAVKIDDMQIFEALCREDPRLLRRIAMKNGRARHVALLKAHRFAIFQIDGRKENHGFHVRKLAINASPSFWLFSG